MGGRGGKGGGNHMSKAQTKAFRAHAIKAYQSGKSLSQIGKETGKASSTVHRHLVSSGQQLRPRGGTTKKRGG